MSHDNPEELLQPKTFRDRIGTVDAQGKRVWIYPRKPKGFFYKWRTVVSWILLTVLFVTPFLKWNGRPLFLFNVIKRKFILFGIGFWPQDFHLFALALITFIVSIILFTVVFGRLFCGWACPQTVFMEMLFRKIEYWIEGDAPKQLQLNLASWTFDKIAKKFFKHSLFYFIAFFIANIFLAYIIGSDELFQIIQDPVQKHATGFVAIVIFSFVFYGVFSWFREQVCVMVCPYGRLQGVLLDRDSIVVNYDHKRGEPRGIAKTKNSDKVLGDCIDCHLCVEVCPTGIDIRHGTQLECINCTACMDACDGVMTKLKRDTGLIRYATTNQIESGLGRHVTPRVLGYSLVLVLLMSFVGYLLLNRLPLETTILRTPGQLFQELPDGRIQNLFNVQVVNKSFEDQNLTFALKGFVGAEIKLATGAALALPQDQLAESILFVRIPTTELKLATQPIEIEVYSHNKLIEVVQTNFKSNKN